MVSIENVKRTFEVDAKQETKNTQQLCEQYTLLTADCAGCCHHCRTCKPRCCLQATCCDGDVNVVLVCFILFITIGLLQHISNIFRMMQQYTQQKLREALEQA
jgi:hypothetical protein